MEFFPSSPFIAGLVAGASGVMIGHPFDTLKVQYQVSSAPLNLKLSIPSLYRGILPPLITSGSIQSINFSLYEFFRREIFRRWSYSSSSGTAVFLAGTASGSIISVLTTPIGLVKIRQQTARLTQEMPSIRKVVLNIYKSHGIIGFYRGFEPMFVMESVGRGTYLFIYESIKKFINSRTSSSQASTGKDSLKDSSSLSTKVAAASSAGVISWLLVYPFDVIKARLQADVSSRGKYSSVIDCVRKTYLEGGMSAFTRGLGFTLIRAAPVASVALPIYETTRDYLDDAFVLIRIQN